MANRTLIPVTIICTYTPTPLEGKPPVMYGYIYLDGTDKLRIAFNGHDDRHRELAAALAADPPKGDTGDEEE